MLIGTQSLQDLATCWIMGFGTDILPNGYGELKTVLSMHKPDLEQNP